MLGTYSALRSSSCWSSRKKLLFLRVRHACLHHDDFDFHYLNFVSFLFHQIKQACLFDARSFMLCIGVNQYNLLNNKFFLILFGIIWPLQNMYSSRGRCFRTATSEYYSSVFVYLIHRSDIVNHSSLPITANSNGRLVFREHGWINFRFPGHIGNSQWMIRGWINE